MSYQALRNQLKKLNSGNVTHVKNTLATLINIMERKELDRILIHDMMMVKESIQSLDIKKKRKIVNEWKNKRR